MFASLRTVRWLAFGTAVLCANILPAQDWPQWRGTNRDGKTTGFKAPATWPAALTKKWDVPVGSGVSNPSLVGDRLYVIAREGDDEVVRCMNAATGADIWKKSYASEPAEGAGAGGGLFVGPRSTPTVANGRVVTLGVAGILSCFDAASGDLKWRKDELVGRQNVPGFYTSSSPIVVDGLCIAQLGRGAGGGRGRRGGDDAAPPPAPRGGLIAFDLASGDEKWRAPSASPAYGSPVVMTVDGMKVVVALSESQLVAVNTANGNEVWKLPLRQGNYNAATPIVDGQTLIFAGPGTGMTAVKLSKDGDALKEQELWRYTDNNLIFNTPVLKDGALYGLSTNDQLFCINSEHATGWTAPIVPAVAMQLPAQAPTVFAQQAEAGGQREGGLGEGRGQGRGQGEGRGGPGRRGPGGGRGRGRATGGGERAGYGSIVDAGSVLMAPTPGGHFVVFQPKADAYTELARYKVSEDGECYSYPIAAGNRIYTKDKDSVTLWTVE